KKLPMPMTMTATIPTTIHITCVLSFPVPLAPHQARTRVASPPNVVKNVVRASASAQGTWAWGRFTGPSASRDAHWLVRREGHVRVRGAAGELRQSLLQGVEPAPLVLQIGRQPHRA